MTVFNQYAAYYDLLYQDKNYSKEVEFIQSIIQKYEKEPGSILELGCGTGAHAELLARQDYKVTGLDRSAEMLARAEKRVATLDPTIRPSFLEGDVTNFNLDRKFDVILSLFHVVSYITCQSGLKSLFDNVFAHLRPGGLFIFDVWYGPAVFFQKPLPRIKKFENSEMQITRFAEPNWITLRNIVEIHYDITIKRKQQNEIFNIQEKHAMRYFFQPEIEQLLDNSQLRLLSGSEWMTGREISPETWGVCYVATK